MRLSSRATTRRTTTTHCFPWVPRLSDRQAGIVLVFGPTSPIFRVRDIAKSGRGFSSPPGRRYAVEQPSRHSSRDVGNTLLLLCDRHGRPLRVLLCPLNTILMAAREAGALVGVLKTLGFNDWAWARSTLWTVSARGGGPHRHGPRESWAERLSAGWAPLYFNSSGSNTRPGRGSLIALRWDRGRPRTALMASGFRREGAEAARYPLRTTLSLFVRKTATLLTLLRWRSRFAVLVLASRCGRLRGVLAGLLGKRDRAPAGRDERGRQRVHEVAAGSRTCRASRRPGRTPSSIRSSRLFRSGRRRAGPRTSRSGVSRTSARDPPQVNSRCRCSSRA